MVACAPHHPANPRLNGGAEVLPIFADINVVMFLIVDLLELPSFAEIGFQTKLHEHQLRLGVALCSDSNPNLFAERRHVAVNFINA